MLSRGSIDSSSAARRCCSAEYSTSRGQALEPAVAQPLIDKLPEGSTLLATGVVSTFMTPFKVSFYVALFLAMPVVLYQLWAFVAPGLYRREKRFAVPLLVSAVLLFYCGVVFAYFVVFPVMFPFLIGTTPGAIAHVEDRG